MIRPLTISATLLMLATGAFAFSRSSPPAYSPAAYTATKTVQYEKKKMIAPSEAARIARSVAPSSKLLNVRLSGGNSPRYVVRARERGQVREIVINALTGVVVSR